MRTMNQRSLFITGLTLTPLARSGLFKSARWNLTPFALSLGNAHSTFSSLHPDTRRSITRKLSSEEAEHRRRSWRGLSKT